MPSPYQTPGAACGFPRSAAGWYGWTIWARGHSRDLALRAATTNLVCLSHFPVAEGMEVHFTPEQEAQIADTEHVVKDTVLRPLAGNPPVAREAGGVLAEMRRLRSRAKPQGWTTRDYVHYGRR